MADQNPVLKFRKIWLGIGLLLIAIVVQQTLTPSPVGVAEKFSDKFLHVVGYFVLMGWFVQLCHQEKINLIWLVFFVVMGVGLEFLQGMSGVRQYEVNDMLANTCGAVLAWLLSCTRFSMVLITLESALFKK